MKDSTTVYGSRAEVHNVVSLVTMDVAPGVTGTKQDNGSTSSVDRSISAAAQHGD